MRRPTAFVAFMLIQEQLGAVRGDGKFGENPGGVLSWTYPCRRRMSKYGQNIRVHNQMKTEQSPHSM